MNQLSLRRIVGVLWFNRTLPMSKVRMGGDTPTIPTGAPTSSFVSGSGISVRSS